MWTFNQKRSEYFRSYTEPGSTITKAVVNWESGPAVEDVKKVVEFWVNKGVDGFYIGHAHLLALDDSGRPDWGVIARHVRLLRDMVHKNTTKREV